jgi:hypothetical protein
MKKFIIILLAVAALGIAGCEKWLDVNHNPNSATTATPDLILPGVLYTFSASQGDFGATAAAWMGYWYHAGGWSGWYTTKKYDISTAFADYTGYYTGPLTDNVYVRKNSGSNVVYPAITDVVDAWYYSRLVDLYGDMPYSEACKPELTLSPKYDDAETIYKSLIHRLNNAIAVFDSAVNGYHASANPIYFFKKSVDIIYQGDFTKWEKFANTLKLRLVMRMTNVRTAAQLKTEMDSTVARGFITSTVTSNPGYSVSSGKTMPLWNSYGKSYNGTLASATTQYCLNSYIQRKLNLLADPRLLQYFYAPTGAAGVLIGTPFGTDGDLVAQPNVTKAGNYSFVLIANNYTGPTGSPIVSSGDGSLDPSKIFLLSEAYFLQAEAISRGIIAGGNAAAGTAYTNGIKASLADSKVIAADQTTYLANVDVAWNAGWSAQEQIKRIINQKWIANYFINFVESYNDYRRTGYPNPIHPGYVQDVANDPLYEMLTYYPSGIVKGSNNSRQIPRIMMYPQGEFNINKAAVQAAVDKITAKYTVTFVNTSWPFDARVFWDTAPKNGFAYPASYNY